MITLEGLTPVQVKLCDDLWNLDSMDEVEEFIAELPTKLQTEARSMQQLIVAAMFDEEVQTEDDCAMVRNILDRY